MKNSEEKEYTTMSQFMQDYLPFSNKGGKTAGDVKDPKQFGSDFASKLLKGIDHDVSARESS